MTMLALGPIAGERMGYWASVTKIATYALGSRCGMKKIRS